MLSDHGFPFKFIEWIMECVTTISYSSMSGGLTKQFQGKRRIRQGDPMSPYLYVITMEYLEREVMQLVENGDFNFHLRCRKLGIIHICFADDLLMFCRADIESIILLQGVFQRFSTAFGLQAKIDKSSIYLAGVDAHEK
ncbi:uncharacterized protein [Nicotiana tomentosiformis]|uniref:uncharacterized protein n=1 Tax=Nicotiana tomentosiformis TaxID=4098 RepID=UPI00388C9BF9